MASAKYIGRVGALALALGVGAAMAGGAGLAHADGTTDNDTGGAGPAQSARDTAARDGDKDAAKEKASADSTSTESSDVVTRKPTSTGVPKTPNAVDAQPESLAGLISRIPTQIADMLGGGGAPGAKTPTPESAALQGNSHTGGGSGDGPSIMDRVTPDATAAIVRAGADDASTASRSGVKTLGGVPSTTADTTRQQRLTTAPVATLAAQSATRSTASAQTTPTPVAPRLANPIATVVSSVLSALGFSPTAGTDDSPAAPIQLVLGALHLLSREIERIFSYQPPSTASFTSAEALANANPAIAPPGIPTPGDQVSTEYGDIGKWMLQSDGQIANYGGNQYEGRTVLEPVNVIIVDPSSKTPAEAAYRLNNAMWWSGFPAQPIHTTGFQGEIDDVTYGQQPTGPINGYSNNFFLLDNDHGRIFGPDPVETSTGYVWSGAFSTETLIFDDFVPGHAYVSSDVARTALATQLILSGKATFVGMVPLDNAYDTDTTTTGDHDGYAVVLQLR